MHTLKRHNFVTGVVIFIALLAAAAAGVIIGAHAFSTHTTTTRSVQIIWHDGAANNAHNGSVPSVNATPSNGSKR